MNRDAIRVALHGQPYVSVAEPFTRAIYKVMIAALFEAGHKYVVADETHYSRMARDFVRDGPWKTFFCEVLTTPDECVRRATATNQPWLLEVIPEMVARVQPLEPDEQKFFWDPPIISYRSVGDHVPFPEP